MCCSFTFEKEELCVCGEKNRARRRTKNFVFFVFFVFFLFFSREERELCFFCLLLSSLLYFIAREFVSHHQRINLFVVRF